MPPFFFKLQNALFKKVPIALLEWQHQLEPRIQIILFPKIVCQ